MTIVRKRVTLGSRKIAPLSQIGFINIQNKIK